MLLLGRGWITSKYDCLVSYIIMLTTMYNPTDNEISLKV